MSVQQTQCCVAGGGPAGMVLALLLARMGVDVVVMEKHADFLRDFRGDTIHPSTLEILYELGLLTEFLKRPHQEIRELSAIIAGETIKLGDFTHLPTHCKFVGLMPQWDFLNFISDRARRYPSFHLKMRAEVTGLTTDAHGAVSGVRAKTPEGEIEIRAALTVGADGRHSTVRDRAGLAVLTLGAPMDVLWMRISRRDSDPKQVLGNIVQGKFLVMIDRDDYWQCAFVIPKGSMDAIKEAGLPALRQTILGLAPYLGDRVEELRDWKGVSLLTVAVDRLLKWHKPGVLCIGDAAHAMSPIGGVGINLAIQDAVATANLLGPVFLKRTPTGQDLQRVQQRRTFPTRATQGAQVFIQNRVIKRVLKSDQPLTVPWPMTLLNKSPVLRRIPARLVGLGVRPEHVHTPEALAESQLHEAS